MSHPTTEQHASSSTSTSSTLTVAAPAQARQLPLPPVSISTVAHQPSVSSPLKRQRCPPRSRVTSPSVGLAILPAVAQRADDGSEGETSAAGARRSPPSPSRLLDSELRGKRRRLSPAATMSSPKSDKGKGREPASGPDASPKAAPSDERTTFGSQPISAVQVEVQPPSSSPDKAVDWFGSSSSRSATREVTPESRSSDPLGRPDSPLTPLPAMYAQLDRSPSRPTASAPTYEDEDDSDEVISSSEKGEGDASPLLPVRSSARTSADDSLEEVSSLPAGVPSSPRPSSTTGPQNKNNTAAPSSVVGSARQPASPPPAGSVTIRKVTSRQPSRLAEDSDSELSEPASVASQLSESDDELDIMEMEMKSKGVLMDKNGTTRPPPAIKKPALKPPPVRLQPVDARPARSTAPYTPGRYKVALSLTAETGPGSSSAKTDAAKFRSLIKATGRRQEALAKSEVFRSSTWSALSDDSDMSDAEEDASTSTSHKGKERATYPTPSTDRRSASARPSSSGTSSSEDEDDDSEDDHGPAPTAEGVLGEDAHEIHELLVSDRAAKRAERQAREALKTKGIGGWTGCWAWGTGRRRASKVRTAKEGWDRIRLEGRSDHPSFALLEEAVASGDVRRLSTLLSCGVLDACVSSVGDQDKLLISLIATAVVTSDAQLSRLATRAAVNLLASYPPDDPVLDPATLVALLRSTFRSIGIRPDLLDPSTPTSSTGPTTAPPYASSSEVVPMSDLARDRAVSVLAQVLAAAALSGALLFPTARLFVPLLAAISLDRDMTQTLASHVQDALASLVGLAGSQEEEMTLCRTIVDFVSPYKMTFKHAVVAAMPQAGPTAPRIVRSCCLAVLGVPLDKSTYGGVSSVDDVVDLISQDTYGEHRSPLYIHPQTDYDQLSAALKIFALVLSDLHRIYLAERRRIDLIQEETDEDERMQRTEIDLIPILKPVEEAIEAADRRIPDSRGADLARTNAKALFLNMQMSVLHRSSKYKALYLRDREGEMRLLD